MPSSQSASQPAGRSAKELAKLTADTYRRAERLSYKALLTQSRGGKEDWRLWCMVANGPRHQCDLEVRDAAGPVFELRIRCDGEVLKFREVNHRGDQHAEYEVPFSEYEEKARGQIRCEKDIDGCRFGSQLVSLVGPDSGQTLFLEEAISEGAWIGTHNVDGHACDVVQTHRVKGLDERFYLDAEMHVIRRWTQTIRGATRDRVFSEIEIVLPEDSHGK